MTTFFFSSSSTGAIWLPTLDDKSGRRDPGIGNGFCIEFSFWLGYLHYNVWGKEGDLESLVCMYDAQDKRGEIKLPVEGEFYEVNG